MKTFLTLSLIFTSIFLHAQWSDNCDPNASNSSTFEITCGFPDNWNNATDNFGNTLTSQVNAYPSCSSGTGWTAPEYKYVFNSPSSGNYTFDLEILGNQDLDMLILDSCNPNTCFNSDGATPSTTSETATVFLNSGQTVYIIIDGWNGAISQYNFSVTCDSNPNGICNENDIDCGETITVSNMNSGNDSNWQDYTCVSSGYNGNDVIVKFERTSSYVTNWITVWNYAREDIDIFILDDCYGNYSGPLDTPLINCIASSTNNDRNCSSGPLNYEAIEISGYPAGTYYIYIDGKTSSDASNQIFVSLSCESLDCDNNTTLTCDNPITSNNFTFNSTSNYYGCYNASGGCYNFEGSWTGGERIFKFTAPEDGDYSFCMDPTGNIDLELFLFTSCCSTQWDPGSGLEVITDFTCFDNCDKAATRPAGQTESITDYPMNAGDMIWLVVDGFLGDEGNFVIEAKCNTFDCDDLFELQCSQRFDDSNVPTSNTAANTQTSDIFDTHNLCNNATDGCKSGGLSNNSIFGNSEVVYYLDGQTANNKDIVIDIFPRISNLDVDLFVYEDCTAAGLSDCERTSTWGPQEDDSVILQDVSSSDEFFVVVDGQTTTNGVNQGRFGISITCGKISDHSPTPITCGDVINGDTRNSNNYISHYCNCPEDDNRTGGGNNGKEDIYQFEITTASDITITLGQFGNQNLELYLLNAFDVEACYNNSRNAIGQSEQIQTNVTPGTYYIIVEGHDADEGSYRLSLEGCDDACALMENIFCEDFENYNFGQFVNLQSNNWVSPFNSNEPDCKIVEVGGNKSLLVESDNFVVCSSLMEFNANSNADIVELSFDLIMPYYNFGFFPFTADGAEIYLFEESSNSQDLIYLAFRPHTSDPVNDDRRVCLNINNVYESDGCSNGSGELFPFNRDMENKIKVRLQKSTGNVSVFINDDLLGNALNSGLNDLGAIGFRGVFNENAGFRVDNICLDACKACPGDVFYITDTEGNPPCNDISINSTSQSNSSNVGMTFSPGANTNGQFIRWEVRDADTENVVNTNTTSASSFNYCCFTPGRSYYVCYYFRDANDCIQFCCIRVDVPTNCNIIVPRYNGNNNTISYELNAENLGTGQSVVAWYDGQASSNIGTTQQITYIPPSTGTRYICCLIYDSIQARYILCCRQICIENPFTCSSIDIQDNNNGTYTLSAPNGTQEITWFLDSPTRAIIGFNNPQTFNPASFGVPQGSAFQVSYRFRDSSGCQRFCCKTFTPTPPQDALTLDLGEVCGPIGSRVMVPIIVQNFEDVNAASFTVQLENNFARIISANLTALPGNPISNVLTPQQMVVAWVNANSVTLNDGSLLGTIEVEIQGNNRQSTAITITGDPSPIAFQNSNNQTIPTNTIAGEVCLATNVMISGRITKSNSQSITNTTVNLTGSSNTTTTTNSSGNYSFDLQPNQNYTVTPFKDGDDRNGVNISDLLRMQKHLVFLERFENPYQWIAADLDNSNSVTIADLLALQKLLVFVTLEFENVNSWKFVDNDHTFPANNPLSTNYPEQISYNPLTSTISNADFVGVKMGDLDNSASSIDDENMIIDSRSTCGTILTDDLDLKAGQTVELEFKTKNFNDVAALINELKFDTDKLEYAGFVSTDLANLSGNSFTEALLANGYLIVNWVSQSGLGVDLPDNSNLYTLRFEVKADSKVSNAIFISNDNLNSEFVDSNINAMCVELDYEIVSSNSFLKKGLIIKEAKPNPFIEETVIKISSDINTKMQLTIFSSNGKIIWNESIQVRQGENDINIGHEKLDAQKGLFIYTLRANDLIHSGKIIRM